MSTSVGRYAGLSAAERRSARRSQLLQTALTVIGEQGTSGLRVRALCQQAGLNDRYFYESFADCDQLIADLLDDQITAAITELMDAISSATGGLAALARTVVTAAIAFVADDPGRRQLLIESQTTEMLRRRRGEMVQLIARLMLNEARELFGDDAINGTHAELAALTVVHGELELVTQWLRGDLKVGRDQLTEFLVAMIITATEITHTVSEPLRP
jgi:AcrR family transcriptional regulator